MKHIYISPLWALLLCAFAAAFTLTACSDDENINESEWKPTNDEEYALIADSLRYNMLISQLCDVEEQPDGTVAYKPCRGKALYAATPTVYYVGIDTLLEAQDTWQCITVAMRDSDSAETQVDEVSLFDLRLTYSEGGDDGELARIDVECPELANVLTSIVFIPMERWAANDKGSPFGFLSVWRKKTVKYGREEYHYYLCVRKAQGDEGVLITFDGDWEADWFKKYDHWQGQFYLWKNTATGNDFAALSSCMRYNTNAFLKALDAMKKASYNDGWGGETWRTLTYVYEHGTDNNKNNEPYSQPFDFDYSYGHHLWWAYNCYDVHIARVGFRTDHTRYEWTDNYTHKKKPVRGHASHSIHFNPDYNNKTADWTCIYKGTS